MKSFARILAVVAVVVLGTFWYRHRASTRALASGEVYVRDQPSAPPKPLPDAPTPPGDQIAASASEQPAAPPTVLSVARTPAPQVIAPPQSDSIPRNPPNGVAFAGSGKFQLYRQGDITWRLDTQSGDACILFATDTQWSQPRVFQAGCGTARVTAVTTGY
jgi:hypothetical protein